MFFFGAMPNAKDKPDEVCEACIGRIALGDRDALGTLYEYTKTAVYGFALSIVQNPHEAEDVLQDTFISIYASAPNYRKLGKPMAWVLTIAKNLALMKIRGRQKTADISEDGWELLAADTPAVTSEDRLVLAAALKTIAPEESRIVMLHAVCGFKHREIAGLLELPLSTVLSKYSRAMKKLKSVLGGGAHAE